MRVFKITDEHITLVTNMDVSYNDYCEFGAPEINPKRPYGNSNVVQDMAELLDYTDKMYDEDVEETEDYEYWERYLCDLHRDCEMALQIILSLNTFETGYYVNDNVYGYKWRKATESEAESLIEQDEIDRLRAEEKEKEAEIRSLEYDITKQTREVNTAQYELKRLQDQLAGMKE